MRQEVVLALLAKTSTHGYQLRKSLRDALGPLGESLNAGQIYVTLARLEKVGLVQSEQDPGLPDRPDRKVYSITAAGQERVAAWISQVSWPKPDLTEFHLKLVAAATGLDDPAAIVHAQRRELMQRLRDAQRAVMDAAEDSGPAVLLLTGIVLRLQADLRWLDACEQSWSGREVDTK